MKIAETIFDLVGNTRLVRLPQAMTRVGNANVLLKYEAKNPTGSVKDRAAKYMILEAETAGRLRPGGTVIEPTSGNTGIGLAAFAAVRGYRMILTMPDTMSIERRKLIAAFGAEIVLTDGKLGMQGAVDQAEKLAREIPGSIIAGQFINPANPMAHYLTTGPEIWTDTDGTIDVFVACVGTGGTLTGTAKYLKEQNPLIEVVAVEPSGSPLLSEGKTGGHKIQGIGANFVPEILDLQLIDRIVTVSDDEAKTAMVTLAKTGGLLTGISSGAAVAAAIKLASDEAYRGKTIVTVLPDTGERYLSILN